jgi:hypothetical protein
MHREGIDSPHAHEDTTDGPDHPVTEAAIMGLLLSGGHAGIWTRAEIELKSAPARSKFKTPSPHYRQADSSTSTTSW